MLIRSEPSIIIPKDGLLCPYHIFSFCIMHRRVNPLKTRKLLPRGSSLLLVTASPSLPNSRSEVTGTHQKEDKSQIIITDTSPLKNNLSALWVLNNTRLFWNGISSLWMHFLSKFETEVRVLWLEIILHYTKIYPSQDCMMVPFKILKLWKKTVEENCARKLESYSTGRTLES